MDNDTIRHADTCVGCVSFSIDYEGDWSEVTPGSGFQMTCGKNHFCFSQVDSQEDFEKAITTSRKCGDFVLKAGFLKDTPNAQ